MKKMKLVIFSVAAISLLGFTSQAYSGAFFDECVASDGTIYKCPLILF
ncbi:hypothetical protein OE749_06720 [Aestuariibacter sp. AA17]|uniref:Uncharacterized protein n=1 Tax=Fluctibacter corallii TaxID=2984329 RepID=A0ABT3A6R8_9ALTE|nr:hypothetical protein [Aestuariibacter sp. AA17]MCV2884384.1 hypothetical protein [Aestuariibacter sp. AA17]